MFHGTKDKTINPRVSVTVYNRLKQCGKDVNRIFSKVLDHGGSEFWTEEVQRIVMEFMNKAIVIFPLDKLPIGYCNQK